MKNTSLNYSELSENRQVVMGGAIFLIMIYHSFSGATSNVLTRLFVTGKIGVELFLLLSGIGMHYSLRNKYNLQLFYKKRIIRILPEYLFVAIPVYFVYTIYRKGGTIVDLFFEVSTVKFFWGEGRFFWFIHLILICYLIAPLYYKIQSKIKYHYFIPLFILLITYVVSYYYRDYQMILLRYASFFMGMSIGELVYECKTVPLGVWIMRLWPLMLVLLYISTYKGEYNGLWLEPFYYFFFSIPILFYLSRILTMNTYIKKIFGFWGTISLELYLLHEMFFLSSAKMLFDNCMISCFVSIALTIPFAWGLSCINKKLLNLFGF